MKRSASKFVIVGLLCVVLLSCSPSQSPIPPTQVPPQPTQEMETPQPTITTISPTATISLAPPLGSKLGEVWSRPIDGMAMVYVPASEVQIGSSETEIDAAFDQCELDRGAGMCDRYWFEDEFPIHTEQLNSFWIDMTEVTNAKYATFLNDQGNQTEGSVQWLDVNDESSMIEQVDGAFFAKEGFSEHPVIEVSWFGARAYCVWIGGWLPTEEKWEYAARGPDRNTYPWGNSAPDCETSNFAGCVGSTLPVGSQPGGSSWVGVQDMGGNVWEWVSNWYRRYPGSQHQDEDFGEIYKIVRGGSWYYEPYYARSALRTLEFYPHIRSDTIGFRCVINVDD